jgi:hypothetical protein
VKLRTTYFFALFLNYWLLGPNFFRSFLLSKSVCSVFVLNRFSLTEQTQNGAKLLGPRGNMVAEVYWHGTYIYRLCVIGSLQ